MVLLIEIAGFLSCKSLFVQNYLNISNIGPSLYFHGPYRLRLHLWSHLHDFRFGFRLI